MKILRIENGNGWFRTSENSEWKEVDKIDKDGLLELLNCFLDSEIDMDVFDEEKLSNAAQQIVYRSVYEKLNALAENKGKFKDESDRKYQDAIEKYSQA